MNHGKCKVQTASKLLNNQQPVPTRYWPANPPSHLPLLQLSRLLTAVYAALGWHMLDYGLYIPDCLQKIHTYTEPHALHVKSIHHELNRGRIKVALLQPSQEERFE